jgi:site-specific recombinase XerD
MDHKTISLVELVSYAKNQLDVLGYAEGTKNQYALKWKHFLAYAEREGHKNFSRELGNAFLKNNFDINAEMKLSSYQVFTKRTITILGELLDYNHFLLCHQKPGKQVPPQFMDVLKRYEKYQFEKEISQQTINGKKSILIRFLNFLNEQRITDISTLTSHEVLSYLHTLGEYSQSSRAGILFTLRGFLLYLHAVGCIEEPLNNLFPVIYSHKSTQIPSYYSTEEIHSILSQVNRNTVMGRLDYLILLLAVQFGMRSGDIRQLQLKHIKWSRNTLELVQQKTKNLLQLPLTKEFKYAFADYMKNSRPKVNEPYVFVRHAAPFQPFCKTNTFHHIINKYMVLAKITLNHRKHGLHAMRHSTANNLLQNCTPYPVITGILGHANTNTTKLYLNIDIEQLRSVALEVPNEK